MANSRDYPITCPFGWVKDYPLNRTDPSRPNYGFHNGIDYGYPYGTPVIVNGVQIGLSGDTGAPGQPHCHVGKWIGGQVQNPGEYNGFTFQSAVVTEIHTTNDSVNGKYVRVQADGASWVYLHLSRIDVQINQVLKGSTEDMTAANLNQMRMILFSIRGYNGNNGRPNALTGAADDVIKGWVGKDLGVAIDSWWNDKGSQDFREKEQPALYAQGPSDVKPYSGPQLYTKG